jgi:hypothetical protein
MRLSDAAKLIALVITLTGIAANSSAALKGPYNAATQDAATTHLWHLDDTTFGTPEVYPGAITNTTPDAVTTGTTFSMINRYWFNSAVPENKNLPAKSTFGHSSYNAGFGRAVNTAGNWLNASGQINSGLVFGTAANDFSPGLYNNYDETAAHDNVNVSTFWNQTTGAFTYEAIVKVGFDPNASFGNPANEITGPHYFSIVGLWEDSNAGNGRDLTNGARRLRFGVLPKGSDYHNTNSTTGLDISDFSKPYLWAKADGAGGEEVAAEIPTTGAHALEKDAWYHVALSYTGTTGPGSTQFYWTKLGVDDATRNAANALTTTGYLGTFALGPDGTADFTIGNLSGTSTATTSPWAGIIDEVRVSTTVRGPGDFLWGTASHAGDFDADGDVDGADFVAWQTNFPTASGATLAQGDADGDGDVDGADFVVWQTNFPFTPSSGAAPIPEPNSILMIGISAIFLRFARRRWLVRT